MSAVAIGRHRKMYTPLLIALGALILIVGLLLLAWSKSGWLADRRNALGRIDRFVDDLNRLSERFPSISAQLDLPKLNDNWPVQRAEVVSEGTFFAWFKAGRPARTSGIPNAEALFRFARSQAEPLSFSIARVEDDPTDELIRRIKAVIDARTGRFLMDIRYVRLSQPQKSADIG